MNEQKKNLKIYEYLDYREFLQDYYNFKKASSNSFSLRVFSDKIGFKAKDFISRVMNGEKNLSPSSASKIASGLNLSVRERSFFEALVLFNQADSTKERDNAFAHIQKILKIVRFKEKQHLMAFYQYEVFSHWRHLVIRSLIGMFGFSGDYESLAKQVQPKVTPDEAKKSVELLEKCNLIQKKSNGEYVLTENAITTGNKTSKLALRGFHQHCLRLAIDSIDREEPSKRNISALTLGISKNSYDQIVEKINEFRKEIALLAEEDENADSVYQMNFQLFPVGGKNN